MNYRLEAESGTYVLSGSDVTFTVSRLIEKIELNDRVSEVERYQILEWAREHYENLDVAIGNVENFSKAFTEALSGKISSDTIQWVLQLLANL